MVRLAATEEQSRGALFLGPTYEDALGPRVEFQLANRINARRDRATEMLAGGIHGQPAEMITDDMGMTLRIAENLAATGAFDFPDVIHR